jgi:hypothetical protein
MMELLALVIALAVAAGVGWVISRPLLRPVRRGSAAPQKVSSLEAEVDQVVDTIGELDFDCALGKVSREDYSARRADLLARGAELLRELDDQRSHWAQHRTEQEQSLEREITARRRAAPRSGGREEEIRMPGKASLAQPKGGGSRRAGHCPRCGSAVQVGDRFCPQCGVALNHGI